jgi:2-oxoglutarate dehydrogenase E1 component
MATVHRALVYKTNPVRETTPTLEISNFGLSTADLNTVFDAAKVININVYPSGNNNSFRYDYCQHIGVEYVHSKPEVVEWIQKKLGVNDNQPKFSIEEKKSILNKLNQAVSLRTHKICRSKTVLPEGGESIIPALDALIEKQLKRVEQFVMGMAHRGRLNVLVSLENLLKISLVV